MLARAQAPSTGSTSTREFVPRAGENLHLVELSRRRLEASDRGRRLDHIWVSRALKDGVSDFRITRDARGWERPSDHVPVTVTLEV